VSGTAALLPLAELTESDLREWRLLADEALEPNPFFDPDFVLPMAAALGDEVSLLVSREGERWQACLPVTEKRGWRGIPAKAVVTWRHPYCFCGTPLMRPEDPHRGLMPLLQLGLALTPGFLGLDLLLAAGGSFEALSTACTGLSIRPFELRRFDRAYLDADADPHTGLSRKHQRNMRRLADRLGDQLGAPLEIADRSGDPTAYDDFLTLESAGWKGEAGTALATMGHSEVFRELCEKFHARGALRLFDLHSNGRTAAMICNLVAGDSAFAFKIAYDEELQKFSPGTQIMLFQLGLLDGDGPIRRLDSCAAPGHPMAERAWAGRREIAILALPRRGLRGAASRMLLRLVTGARRLVGR
jgi:CelD/BcsL family acetyltransferase involved in cellulose biosynthesis